MAMTSKERMVEAHGRYAWRINFREGWREYPHEAESRDLVRKLRRHQRTGRPLGGISFPEKLEGLPGRDLKPRKPGRKGKVDKQ